MFHPMTGKPTRLKFHWYSHHNYTPWGTAVHVACGQDFYAYMVYVDNINDITCLKCMDIATRPVKSSEL